MFSGNQSTNKDLEALRPISGRSKSKALDAFGEKRNRQNFSQPLNNTTKENILDTGNKRDTLLMNSCFPKSRQIFCACSLNQLEKPLCQAYLKKKRHLMARSLVSHDSMTLTTKDNPPCEVNAASLLRP